jgi:hypothetical protein
MDKELQTEMYRLAAQIRAVETVLVHFVETLKARGIVDIKLIQDALDAAIETTQQIAEGRSAVHDIQASRVIEIIRELKKIFRAS